MAGTADLDSPPQELGQGSILAGRYRLLGEQGRGTFGHVWRAEDLQRPWLTVAVKLLRRDLASEQERRRFATEAQALRALADHPQIVSWHDSGEAQGTPFLVMEYVAGPSLADWIRGQQLQQKAISWPCVLHLLRAISAGLAVAHTLPDAGPVLHRDLKPSNILLGEEPNPEQLEALVVKLADFGLARLGESAGTRDGQILGTTEYMAPEQASGDLAQVGPWSDVFSLGVIALELLTLSSLAPDKSLWRTALYGSAPSAWAHLRALRPDVPSAAWAVLRSVLSWQPSKRPQDAAALQTLLATLPTHPSRWQALIQSLQKADVSRLRSLAALVSTLGLVASVRPPVLVDQKIQATARATDSASVSADIPMVRLPGGTFTMGSTIEEMDSALELCRSSLSEPQRGINCTRIAFEDEAPLRTVSVGPFFIDTTEVSVRRFADWLNDQRQRPEAGLRVDADDVESLRYRWVSLRGEKIYDLFDRVPPNRNGLAGGISYDGQRFVVRPGRENKPVVQVSWYGAKWFCEAHGQRLPTEAEWEYAARPSGHDRFPWGDSPPRCADVVFTRTRGDACSGDTGTRDVGYSSQDITITGIKDLSGNVSEWVADIYRRSYAPCAGACLNPLIDLGPTDPKDTHRVHRGGNWAWPPSHIRSALRGHSPPTDRDQAIGFRCAMSIKRAQQ